MARRGQASDVTGLTLDMAVVNEPAVGPETWCLRRNRWAQGGRRMTTAPMSKIWPTRYMTHDEEYGLPRVRELVGAGPSDRDLMALLQKAGHCVSVAAEMFWGNTREEEEEEDEECDEEDGGESDSSSAEAFENSLQVRFDVALSGRPVPASELNALAVELADACETGALIQIWDELKGSKGADPATWSAVERLHARGKGSIPSGTLHLSKLRAPQKMSPARRLHKICKGRRISARARAVDSDEILPRGVAWVTAQQAVGNALDATGAKRIAVARQLQRALGIDLETARGLVTTLKRRKIL